MNCIDSFVSAMYNSAATVVATRAIDTRLLEKACEKIGGPDGLPADVIAKLTEDMTSAKQDKLNKKLEALLDPELNALVDKLFSLIDTVEKIEALIAE